MNKLTKAFLFLVIATVMMIVTTVAISATVEVGDNGTLRASHVISWENTNIVIAQDVLNYGDLWKDAYRHKEIIVPISAEYVFVHDGILHMKKSRVISIGVVYDGTSVHLVRNVLLGSQIVLNWYIIFLVISLILLIPEIYFVRRGKKKYEDDNKGVKIISILITFVLVILAFSAFTGFYDGFVIATGWSAAVSIVSVTLATFLMGIFLLITINSDKDAEDFKFVMGIYAILATLALGSFFIS